MEQSRRAVEHCEHRLWPEVAPFVPKVPKALAEDEGAAAWINRKCAEVCLTLTGSEGITATSIAAARQTARNAEQR
jgi:hypothetical protein